MSLLSLLTIAGVAIATSIPDGVIKIPFERRQVSTSLLSKRNDLNNPQPVPLANGISQYLINVTVGTPPQPVSLSVDTGSSDLWVVAPPAWSSCHDCITPFYVSSSSTANISQDPFAITYEDGTGANGTYFQDTLSIGSFTIEQQTMALGQSISLNEPRGIFGLSMRGQESGSQKYSTVLDTMQSQGLIKRRVFSLYLDDIGSNTGSILFGGYDSAKYSGDLTALAIQPDESGGFSDLAVEWSYFGITGDDADASVAAAWDLPRPAILDSGTTWMGLPQEIYDVVYEQVGAVNDTEYGILVDCNLSGGSLNFGFGGPEGPMIFVPFSELASPFLPGVPPVYLSNGNRACQLGVSASSDSSTILGDTFLRSAYVVYDIDFLEIWMANAVWGTPNSNIVPVLGTGNQGAPSSSAMAGTVTVTTTSYRISATTSTKTTATVATTLSQGPASAKSTLSGSTTSLAIAGAHGAPTSSQNQASAKSTLTGSTTSLAIAGAHGSATTSSLSPPPSVMDAASVKSHAAAPHIAPLGAGFGGFEIWLTIISVCFVGGVFTGVQM